MAGHVAESNCIFCKLFKKLLYKRVGSSGGSMLPLISKELRW